MKSYHSGFSKSLFANSKKIFFEFCSQFENKKRRLLNMTFRELFWTLTDSGFWRNPVKM